MAGLLTIAERVCSAPLPAQTMAGAPNGERLTVAPAK